MRRVAQPLHGASEAMDLKTISMLSALHRGADFAQGFAQLFKFDSLPYRAMSSIAPIIRGIDQVSLAALNRERRGWLVHYGVGILRTGVERYGQRLMTLCEDRIDVWTLGQHVVLWENHWADDVLSTKSPLDQLARAVLSTSLADLGPTGRAMVADRGLVADPESAPAQMTPALRTARSRDVDRSSVGIAPRASRGGKTAASRQIAEALAGTTVVVSAEIWGGFRRNGGLDIFDMLCRPDCVIFDDLDRAIQGDGDAYMVGGISRVRAAVPLVIVTANVHDEFTGAMLRPGRIADRLLRFDRLDDSVARSASPNVSDDVRAKAIEWGLLAAYLRELDIRCAAGTDDPSTAFNELVHRQASAGDGLAILREIEQKEASGAGS